MTSTNRAYLLISLVVLQRSVSGRECISSDFEFDYTECDKFGQRWKVAVPRSSSDSSSHCTDGNVPFPERGLNCSFSCAPGQYLDIETQKCRSCAPGSYSLGGGVRFDEFSHLPAEFLLENFDDSEEQLDGSTKPGINCPTEAGWVVRNSELMYLPTPCVSKFSYTVHLVRPGHVEWVYRMPKNSRGLMFNVIVKNDQCQSYRDQLKSLLNAGDRSSSRGDSDSGDWKRRRVEMKTGTNIITWLVVNAGGKQVGSILVSRIDIMGIAFTRTCTLCPAGTSAPAGAKECVACKAGQFSKKGEESCNDCPMSQYSGPKSAECLERPPCTMADFYPVSEPCRDGKTSTVYKSVQPRICDESLSKSIKTPPPGPKRPCPKCNPGMSMDKLGNCNFCPNGQFSDGNDCKPCPANTIPNYGYQFEWWNTLPHNMATKCEYLTEAEHEVPACNVTDSWLPSGDTIRTSPTRERGLALELTLNVPDGFANPLLPIGTKSSMQNPIAFISFVFETQCHDASCVLYFVEDSPSPGAYFRLLADFNGTQQRQAFRHPITRSNPTRFMWAFVRSSGSEADDAIGDVAIVHAINVTNLAKLNGGASTCLPCAIDRGGNGKSCLPCPPGHYMTETKHACIKCPPGTMLNSTGERMGVTACLPCGPNLQSSDGIACTIETGQLTMNIGNNKTRTYDLSSLKNRTFTANGVRVFAREGTSYYHVFNVSLMGGTVQCDETYELESGFTQANHRESVEAAVCRSTALPVRATNNASEQVVYVSPLALANRLIAVLPEPSYRTARLGANELDYDNLDENSRPSDLHFFYESAISGTDNCPNGINVVVSARCDSSARETKATLPKNCSDGTCDGCLYHVIITSSSACPICKDSDYTEIKGECINSQQTIHSIPPKHCVLSGKQSRERVVHCSVLSQQLRLLIAGAVGLAAMLCLILVVVCRRNRKLEYKYMKLVETKAGADGFELPTAESCGLEDDEEEEDGDEHQDRVVFAKGKQRFFGGKSKNKNKVGQKMTNNRRTVKDTDRDAFVPLEEADDG